MQSRSHEVHSIIDHQEIPKHETKSNQTNKNQSQQYNNYSHSDTHKTSFLVRCPLKTLNSHPMPLIFQQSWNDVIHGKGKFNGYFLDLLSEY